MVENGSRFSADEHCRRSRSVLHDMCDAIGKPLEARIALVPQDQQQDFHLHLVEPKFVAGEECVLLKTFVAHRRVRVSFQHPVKPLKALPRRFVLELFAGSRFEACWAITAAGRHDRIVELEKLLHENALQRRRLPAPGAVSDVPRVLCLHRFHMHR